MALPSSGTKNKRRKIQQNISFFIVIAVRTSDPRCRHWYTTAEVKRRRERANPGVEWEYVAQEAKDLRVPYTYGVSEYACSNEVQEQLCFPLTTLTLLTIHNCCRGLDFNLTSHILYINICEPG
jgi:hypothetical protein